MTRRMIGVVAAFVLMSAAVFGLSIAPWFVRSADRANANQ